MFFKKNQLKLFFIILTATLLVLILSLIFLFDIFNLLTPTPYQLTRDERRIIESQTEFQQGILDGLVLNSSASRPNHKEIKLKISKIDFQKHIITDNFISARSVHSADIDNDGDADILGAARYIHEIAWWENQGNNKFLKHIIDNNFQGAFSVHSADLNNDGYEDIIGASLYGGIVAWWENNQNSTFGPRQIIDNHFAGAIYTYSFDMDKDGYMDILAAAESANQIAWWRNKGSGVFGERIIVGSNFTGARSVHVADIDNDGDIDILGAARFIDEIAWWENKDGKGNIFQKHTIDNSFDGPRSVHAVDIDNDGDIDILGAARYGHKIALWENDNNQNFTKIIIDYAFRGATNVFSADINKDGEQDIIAAAVFGDQVVWWSNEGNRQFTKSIIDHDFDAATFVYPTDINKDGYLDILSAAVFDNQIALWISIPQYKSSGTFISNVIEKPTNNVAYFNWIGVAPQGTPIRFQIRSGSNRESLDRAVWKGPSQDKNYYMESGTQINTTHSPDTLMQYRVIFETDNFLLSPSLDTVFISYEAPLDN